MFAPSQQWIEQFGQTTHDVCHNLGLPVNSCIEQSRVGVEVARRFGYLAVPVAVSVLVSAGKSVVVLPGPPGWGGRRGGFQAHLLLHFPAANIASDLTSDQFNRPANGMWFSGPIMWPCTREQLAGGVRLDVANRPGLSITYQERPDDVLYRIEPAWALPPGPAADLIEIALRGALAGTPLSSQRTPARTGASSRQRRRVGSRR